MPLFHVSKHGGWSDEDDYNSQNGDIEDIQHAVYPGGVVTHGIFASPYSGYTRRHFFSKAAKDK
uniref:Uncharacterized protein n=1 Tax=Arion vulgaris TaxID=1028688 RepID=A0A0B6ZUF8_9EUPU